MGRLRLTNQAFEFVPTDAKTSFAQTLSALLLEDELL